MREEKVTVVQLFFFEVLRHENNGLMPFGWEKVRIFEWILLAFVIFVQFNLQIYIRYYIMCPIDILGEMLNAQATDPLVATQPKRVSTVAFVKRERWVDRIVRWHK